MWHCRSSLRVLSLLALLTSTSTTSLRIQIYPSPVLPNPHALSASTHATLTSGVEPPLHALLQPDNTLTFPHIPTAGTHLLTLFSPTHLFAPYRIDTNATTILGIWETFPGTQWSDVGPPLLPTPTASATVQAKVLAKKKFYEERQGFDPMSLLKNPMLLLGIVALGITFGMPKLMENMDPEMKAEYEEMQKKGPMSALLGTTPGQATGGAGGAGGVGDMDLAGWLAGAKKPTASNTGTDTGGSSARERKRN